MFVGGFIKLFVVLEYDNNVVYFMFYQKKNGYDWYGIILEQFFFLYLVIDFSYI